MSSLISSLGAGSDTVKDVPAPADMRIVLFGSSKGQVKISPSRDTCYQDLNISDSPINLSILERIFFHKGGSSDMPAMPATILRPEHQSPPGQLRHLAWNNIFFFSQPQLNINSSWECT